MNRTKMCLCIQIQLCYEDKHSVRKWEKNHPMVPPLDHFQGKNKNWSSLARMISVSGRSFFANLTTFERRSGLKRIFPLKIAILRRENFFSPVRRSKVVKFTKNDRLNALIVLARDERFSFFPWKWSKGGTIGQFFPHFLALRNLVILLVYTCFITSSPHNMSIQEKWPSYQVMTWLLQNFNPGGK